MYSTPGISQSSFSMGLVTRSSISRADAPGICTNTSIIGTMICGSSSRGSFHTANAPVSSAAHIKRGVTRPMEKLLWEIPGVEYIYSTTSPGMSMAIVRFYVGQDEEKSIVRLNQKLLANFDLIPPGASQPLVKPRSIDDVPILALTLSSRRYNDFDLRRIASQLNDTIKQVPDVSAVTLMGGQRREVRIVLDPGKLAAYQMSPSQVAGALGLSNRRLQIGRASCRE